MRRLLEGVRQHPVAAFGVLLLAAAIALDAATLTAAPPVFGDEAYMANRMQSLTSGGGFFPSMSVDYGVYPGGHDYWVAKIGSIPQIVAAYIGPVSFTYYRAVSLVVALGALGVFWWALRRLHGWVGATFGAAALATTWAFFSASHYIRWDPVALMAAAAILGILLGGPLRRPLAIAGLGLLVGLCSDFAYSMLGVVPGVALLVAWEPGGRIKRLAWLGLGIAAGLAVFYAIHILPDPDAAHRQYDLAYKPSYGTAPIVEAVKDRSLDPILDESDRYKLLLQTTYRANVLMLLIGLGAALLSLLSLRGAVSRRLPELGAYAFALGLLALVIGHGTFYNEHVNYQDYVRYAVFVLLAGGLAALAWLFARDRPEYPRYGVAAVLLLSQVAGWGLLQAYKIGTHTDFAIPYAVAAVLAATELLAPAARRQLAVAVTMSALAIGGSTYAFESVSGTPDAQPAIDAGLSEQARIAVPEGNTVMGEQVYWWLYRNQQYRTNTTIWIQEFKHPEWSFQQAFNSVRPDYVLLDDLWLSRYSFPEFAKIYPNEAPSDPAEEGALIQLLRTEYTRVKRIDFHGQVLTIWRSRARRSTPG